VHDGGDDALGGAVPMKTENSPKSLRGLTHREIGDFTESFAVLMETRSPSSTSLSGR